MRELTAKKYRNSCWPLPACPAVFEDRDSYLIIGKLLDPKDFELLGRVADGEVLISVPKKIIDEKLSD